MRLDSRGGRSPALHGPHAHVLWVCCSRCSSGIHFIGFSTEHDFYPGSWQYRWIEMDLKRAAANRANVPVRIIA